MSQGKGSSSGRLFRPEFRKKNGFNVFNSFCDCWEDFHDYVRLKIGAEKVTVTMNQKVLQFCIEAEKRGKKYKKKSEDDLQVASFGHLVAFGDKTIENTSAAVKNHGVVNLRKYDPDIDAHSVNLLCTARSMKLPKAIIRVPVINDTTLIGSAVVHTKLPSDRLSPWSTMGFIEYKQWFEDLYEHIQQCIEYCRNIITVCPGRRVVFCCLTNGHELMFLASYYVGEKLCHAMSAVIESQWSACMASYLSSSPTALGFDDAIHSIIGNRITKGLGRGSSSAVAALSDGLLVKVSRDVAALQNEVYVTTSIRDAWKQMVEEGSLSRDQYFNLSERIPRCTMHDAHPHLQSQQIHFDHLKGGLNPSELLELWNLVQMVHRAGFVHRDIRLPNVVRNARGEIALIDFSSAHAPSGVYLDVSGVRNPPPGSAKTASYRVVDAMYKMQDVSSAGNYQCSFDDEAVSVILLAVQQWPKLKTIPASVDFEEAKEYWEGSFRVLEKSNVVATKGVLASNAMKLQSDQLLSWMERDAIVRESLTVVGHCIGNYKGLTVTHKNSSLDSSPIKPKQVSRRAEVAAKMSLFGESLTVVGHCIDSHSGMLVSSVEALMKIFSPFKSSRKSKVAEAVVDEPAVNAERAKTFIQSNFSPIKFKLRSSVVPGK